MTNDAYVKAINKLCKEDDDIGALVWHVVVNMFGCKSIKEFGEKVGPVHRREAVEGLRNQLALKDTAGVAAP